VQALLIPERIASLILVSTAAQLVRTTVSQSFTFEFHISQKKTKAIIFSSSPAEHSTPKPFFTALASRLKLFIPRSLDAIISDIRTSYFSPGFLAAPDIDGVFPTNADRFAAEELRKRQDRTGFTRKGFICQGLAANGHRMSPRQLNELANRLGRGKIVVCHGGADKMVPVQHADVLLQGLNGESAAEEDEVRKQIWPDLGHGLLLEGAEALKRLIEDTIRKTEVMP
jgi:pimeloyl-ACP methyl ester carboxylesterase